MSTPAPKFKKAKKNLNPPTLNYHSPSFVGPNEILLDGGRARWGVPAGSLVVRIGLVDNECVLVLDPDHLLHALVQRNGIALEVDFPSARVRDEAAATYFREAAIRV
jgi:hypothetical protein